MRGADATECWRLLVRLVEFARAWVHLHGLFPILPKAARGFAVPWLCFRRVFVSYINKEVEASWRVTA